MNIKHLFLAAATLGVFAACSDYDPGMSEDVIDYTDEELATIQEYTANFIERYGEIDPNHTWGFGEIGSEDEAMSTRTQIAVNRNQWITFTKENGSSDYNSFNYAVINGEIVPGFPSATDGVYYIEEVNNGAGGAGYGNKGCTLDDIYAYLNGSNQQSVVPVGDVTDEEILYVSTWFRTHKNPTSERLNASSFFVQSISKDYDRVDYQDVTDMANPPEWYNTTTYDRLTNLPIKYYLNGVETNYDYNGNAKPEGLTSSPIAYGLDWLAVQKDAYSDYEHINNFNSGNTPEITSDKSKVTSINVNTGSAVDYGINGTSYRMIEYVYNTGTHDFEVHSSDVNEMNNHWVLKHLTFNGREGNHYDGWYLAFDIAYKKAEETKTSDPNYSYYLKTRDANGNLVEGIEGTWEKVAYRDFDGYYSNYIVKIIPGNGNTPTSEYTHKWHRIMCEDLGNTYDYDFNDLVYDVYYTGTSGNYTAHIKLQAAGGTYPIYLGTHPTEIHEVLGGTVLPSGLYQPINVGGMTGSAAEFTIEGFTDTNPDNININIHTRQTGNSRTNNDFTLPRAGEIKNSAPQKICIPGNTTKWTKENQQIEWAYPHFAEWVGTRNGQYRFADWVEVKDENNNVIDWNLVPASGVTPWNTTDVDVEHKYLYY